MSYPIMGQASLQLCSGGACFDDRRVKQEFLEGLMQVTKKEETSTTHNDKFFVPSAIETMFWRPRFLIDAQILPHVPFLFWIVGVIWPRQLAVLGANDGAAHFALCQALDKQNIAGRCQGFGNWIDPSSGQPLAQPPEALREHADQLYDGISELIACADLTEAHALIDNKSLDLCLVDCTQFEDQDDPDFEAWLNCLKPTGVLLIHGVRERSPSAPLRKKLSAFLNRQEHVQFNYGAGMAIVTKGMEQPHRLRTLLNVSSNGDTPSEIDLFFRRLGQGLEASAQRDALKLKTARAQGDLKKVRKENQQIEEKLSQLDRAFNERSRKLTELQTSLFEAETEKTALQEDNAALKENLDKAVAEQAELAAQFETEKTALQEDNTTLKENLDKAVVENSKIAAQFEAERTIRFEETASLARMLEQTEKNHVELAAQFETEKTALQEDNTTLKENLDKAVAEQAELTAQFETEKTALQEDNAALKENLDKAVAEQAELTEQFKTEQAARFKEITILTSMLEKTQRTQAEVVARYEAQQKANNEQIEILKTKIFEAQTEIETLRCEQRTLSEANKALIESTSWRITAPFRQIKTSLTTR